MPDAQGYLRQSCIHFIGAGGIASSGISVAIKRRVKNFTASDENVLAPADAILASGGIEILDGYREENVPEFVDLAVIGSSIARDNPEIETVLRRRIPFVTWPAALPKLGLLAPHNGVVAGTDGKTTSSCMWTWILQHCGFNPDHMIGGQVALWENGVRLQGADHCVLEGDEYPCGLGDRNPKFLHYKPEVVVLTNIHFDHPDAFRHTSEIEEGFRQLRDILPPDGLLVYNADDPRCRNLAAEAHCPTIGFGFSRKATERISDLRFDINVTRFLLAGQSFVISQAGRMNAANAAAVALACRHWGVSLKDSADALLSFPGAVGRQTILGDNPLLTLISDTAYHPNAVLELLKAMRNRYRGRRLGLVLQPRHTSGPTNWQQKLWPRVLTIADRVILTDPLNPHGDSNNRFSAQLAALQANSMGGNVIAVGPPELAGTAFEKEWCQGDVWILCLADWFVQPREQILETMKKL